MRGENNYIFFLPLYYFFSIPFPSLALQVKQAWKSMSEDPQAYERHAEANFKPQLRPFIYSFLGHLGCAENKGKANQRANLAAQPAVMQRPQHGAMLSQLRCSWAKREPMGLPTASLHRSPEPKQLFCWLLTSLLGDKGIRTIPFSMTSTWKLTGIGLSFYALYYMQHSLLNCYSSVFLWL